ncbi:MAG: hypothetical protein K8W52_42095 [Deltaproteobacteria bacterium]|nr:hypothetical protein [Deltaproteobacteria bacterium]
MRLVLDYPAGWRVTHDEGGERAERDGAVLRVEPSIALPADVFVVGRRWLIADLPGAALTSSRVTEHTTRDGWPVAILEAELATDNGPRGRVVALYRLLDHLGVVRLDAAPAWLAAERAANGALLLAAGVDWGDAPVAIAQLWGG